MPELDGRYEALRQKMNDDRAAAEQELRDRIAEVLAPIVDAAKTRHALRQWKDWLEEKHWLQGYRFTIYSENDLAWLVVDGVPDAKDDPLKELIWDAIQENTKDVSLFCEAVGAYLEVKRPCWSWKQFRSVPLRIKVKFDYSWYESAPR